MQLSLLSRIAAIALITTLQLVLADIPTGNEGRDLGCKQCIKMRPTRLSLPSANDGQPTTEATTARVLLLSHQDPAQ
ncbi:hypothetical protein EDD17DRAFT_1606716 [Pisolithus thermaeus]|nr:hypothetical protein EDD17DRAFT_1606716 [Pisolithus thermaeus]